MGPPGKEDTGEPVEYLVSEYELIVNYHKPSDRWNSSVTGFLTLPNGEQPPQPSGLSPGDVLESQIEVDAGDHRTEDLAKRAADETALIIFGPR